MTETATTERIDILLAMALMWEGDRPSPSTLPSPLLDELDAERQSAIDNLFTAFAPLSELEPVARATAQRRAAWYAELQLAERERWLRRVLRHAQARTQATLLDEHIHWSHIVEALSHEPRRIQAIVLNHLPPSLAQASAADLTFKFTRTERRRGSERRRQSSRSWQRRRAGAQAAQTRERRAAFADRRGGNERRRVSSRDGDKLNAKVTSDATLTAASISPGTSAMPATTPTATPPVVKSSEFVEVVRRAFLARFVARGALDGSSPLDALSGVQLARFVRLLGARETAIACRGVMQIEAVASFLRRFAAEDARSIAAHIAALTDVDAERIAFAEQLVHAAMSRELDGSAMLDHVGLSLLAATMSAYDPLRLRYIEQKLPLAVARALQLMIDEWRGDTHQVASDNRESFGAGIVTRGMTRQIISEIEVLADDFRRAARMPGMPSERSLS